MKLKTCLRLFVVAAVITVQGMGTLNAARVLKDVLLYTASPSYLPLAWMNAAERFPKGAAIYIEDANRARKLFPDFAMTADANVSFDGSKLLFAGKRQPSDAWQIWEASFADLAPRQITSGSNDSIRPFYLPAGRLVYSTRIAGRFALMNAAISGDDQQQISFAAYNVVPSDVLRDGRILVDSAFAGQKGNEPEVYAVYSDGSGIESIRCDHQTPRYAGRELESGNIVFTHGTRLAKFTSPLASESAVKSPEGTYSGDVSETSTHDWIISRSLGARYQLWLWNPRTSSTTLLASVLGEDVVQPVVKRARPVPKKHPSALHDWKYANLLALNVYTSKLPLAAGSVVGVSVYARDNEGERFLGTAQVEADGSFFVRVPGDQPIRFELKDAKGETLQREKGWFWAKSGEQRICVGCHAGPERAPENAVPQVLEKSTEPVDLTRAHSKSTGDQ